MSKWNNSIRPICTLRKSGFKDPIERAIAINHELKNKTRKRNITWFNPPYSMNVPRMLEEHY